MYRARAVWLTCNRYSKYTSVAARAVRNSLKETERVAAERRSLQELRYQKWHNGEASEQVRVVHAHGH